MPRSISIQRRIHLMFFLQVNGKLVGGPIHLAIIAIYKQFYIENSGGKMSLSKRMISLKERWGPVWEMTPTVLGCTWIVDGVTHAFNHKSLDLHPLPFVNFNPTDPYSLIMVMVCLCPSYLYLLTLFSVGLCGSRGVVHAQTTYPYYHHPC